MASTTLPVHNFVIRQGESVRKRVSWKQDEALTTPVNLTGYTARMHLKSKITDTAPALSLTTENGGLEIVALDGHVFIVITAAQTSALSAKYVYDLELVTGESVYRILQGGISIAPGVTA